MNRAILPYINLEAGLLDNLCKLRDAIIRGLVHAEDCHDWASPTPSLAPVMRGVLTPNHLAQLVKMNILGKKDETLYWNFQPFYGNGLLLFRDLNFRRFEREFVWLQTSVDSGSWSLPESVAISEGMTVLDLGCGSGLNALRTALNGAFSTGIDINARAINVANCNKTINGLERVKFYHADWNDQIYKNFDLIISQPPFDPELPEGNRAYAFGGGGDYGLRRTAEILTRFQPEKAGQRLQLYVHSFVRRGESLLEQMIRRFCCHSSNYFLDCIKAYDINSWWTKYKDRHRLRPETELPKDWAQFEEVRGYFVSIWQPLTKECGIILQ